MSKSDKIAHMVLSKFNSLKSSCNGDLGKVILAGFVMENENCSTVEQALKVISIGTGVLLSIGFRLL